MNRREFVKNSLAGAAALAAPQIVRAEARTTINFVPHADLASLDPVWTTADITRNFHWPYTTRFPAMMRNLEPSRRWSKPTRPKIAARNGT